MSTAKLQYNERSWAIDLISHINSLLPRVNLSIKRASGENTLKTGKNLLFPDVLLYSSKSHGHVLQGWELKMPDTPIDDNELIGNAKKKAIALQLNSYVVWNVKTANLYILNEVSNEYELYPEPLYHNEAISTRNDVSNKPDLWKNAAYDILAKINRFFEGGRIAGVAPGIIFSNDGIINQLLSCHAEVKLFIENEIQRDNTIDAKVDVWWRQVKHQYPGEDSPAGPLAYNILFRWFNRFVFSNILKAYTSEVKNVEKIDYDTTIQAALNVFTKISEKTNFVNVFQQNDFDALLPDEVWDALIDFNKFLSGFEFAKIDKAVLESIVHSAVLSSIKKAAGLYITPEPLAYLLVLLTLSNKSDVAVDPFCGTGTIVNAILSTKSEYNVSGKDAIRQTWGSDKFAFPVQIATLAVSTPEVMHETLRIFTHDAFDLYTGKAINFIDPSTGEIQKISIPKFDAIISNLPFVRFEDIKELNPSAQKRINDFYAKNNIPTSERLDSRSDLFAYVPFMLYDLLDEEGFIGIIVSNSWLPAGGWGAKFKNLLKKFYSIKYIVCSGNGKWFSNAKVVTNILVCQKKTSVISNKEVTFATTLCSIENCEMEDIKQISSHTLLASSCECVTANNLSNSELDKLQEHGIGWNSCFANLKWFLNNATIFKPVKFYAEIARGERRGWDKMFYPCILECDSICNDYLQPVILSSKDTTSLTIFSTSDNMAFCCSSSMEELAAKKRTGTIQWIKRFQKQKNKKGIPLPSVLSRTNLYWYQMTPRLYTKGFVISVNPNDRLFVPQFLQKTVINQRLITIIPKAELDFNLFHALLNSIYTISLIEAIGFGRGQGVLDINPTNIKKGLHVPQIELISDKDLLMILNAFKKLKQRKVKPILDELKDPARVEFDKIVSRAVGLSETDRLAAYEALKTLYNIRKSVGR
jgi:type I restriction-modification system DNA methylase subunit